eukprot:4804735-Pyramimonas_sp.AAC.1
MLPVFALLPPPTDCTLVGLSVVPCGTSTVFRLSLAMAIASITSVISHVSGVSSRVSTSPFPTTAIPRTVSPYLSAVLASVRTTTSMCRDLLMTRDVQNCVKRGGGSELVFVLW